MVTKISIIDIDLGASVDEIIDDNLARLTSRNSEEIANAVEQGKRVQEYLNRQQIQKQVKENKEAEITKLLAAMEAKLLDSPMIAADIFTNVSSHIATIGAFTARMKTYLRNQGNKYALHRYTKHKCTYYSLIPFNHTDEEQPAEPVDG